VKSMPKPIRAVLFDFDGTLTRPGNIDFAGIKAAIGCPPDIAILEFLDALDDPVAQSAAQSELNRYEREAALKAAPNSGAERLIADLKSMNLQIGVVSRNSMASIRIALENFESVGEADFDLILSRDSPAAPKPSPEGILLASEKLGIAPEEIMVVGDYAFDIQAGSRAGAMTVFLTNNASKAQAPAECSWVICCLAELTPIVRKEALWLSLTGTE